MKSFFNFIINGDKLEKVIFTGGSNTAYCNKPDLPKNIKIIGKNAFQEASYINSIQLPSGIEIIEEGAFKNCNLLHITLPDSVREIGNECFAGCRNLSFIKHGLNIKKMGVGAFKDCEKLDNFIFPENVTEIEAELFADCNNLETITLHDSITKIGVGAFKNCKKLCSFVVPNKITEIQNEAFAGCDNLQKITLHDSLIKIGYASFENCKKLDGFVLPKKVKEIKERTFYNCTSLQHITLHDAITVIGYSAFAGCSKLKSITIPKDVTKIEKETFADCISLEGITLHDSITVIGSGAFRNCKNLKDFVIPEKITEIEPETFDGCCSLRRLKLNDSIEKIGKSALKNCCSLKDLNIPDSVCTIESELCNGCYLLNKVCVSNKLKNIGNKAFEGCKNIEYFYYKDSKKTLFKDIKEQYQNGILLLPDSVEKIGDYAFYNCGIFENLVFPKNISNIGIYAFYDCGHIKNIKYNCPGMVLSKDYFNNPPYLLNPDDLTSEIKENCLLEVIDIMEKKNCPAFIYETEWKDYIRRNIIKNLNLIENPNYLNYVLREKLIDCKNIPSILKKYSDNIELSAKLIGYENENFSSEEITKANKIKVHIASPDSAAELSKIWNYQSLDNDNVIITGYKGDDNDIIVPGKIGNKRVSAISKGCFSPDYVRISKNRETRKNIKKITLSEGIEKIGQICNKEFIAGSFESCESLTEIVFPASLRSIDGKAFINCKNLRKLTFLGTLENLSSGAFNKELNIKDLVFENQISKNASHEFEVLKSVENVVFGNGVSVVYSNMLKKCDGLKTVICKNKKITFEENALPKLFFITNFTSDFIKGDFHLLSDNSFDIKLLNNLPQDKKECWYNYMQQELFDFILSSDNSSKDILLKLIEEHLFTPEWVKILLKSLNNQKIENTLQKEKIELLKSIQFSSEKKYSSVTSSDFLKCHLKAIRKILINI